MTEAGRRIAIIDLGTNTFNVLIAEAGEQSGEWSPLFNNSIPVKLGQGGIARHAIAWDRFVRGVDAMMVHKHAINNYRCAEIHAYATSAVREASNGKEFTDAIRSKTDISVKVIGGQIEAELIHLGVVQTLSSIQEPLLIMDIGGGSTEFIISHAGKVQWKESFPLGVSRMAEVLELPDPLKKAGKKELEGILEGALGPLWEAVTRYSPKVLVGASGSFNTFRKVLQHKNGLKHQEEGRISEFNPSSFRDMLSTFVEHDYESRLKLPGMHPMRADSIQLSAVFANYIIQKLALERIFQSDYALKEGALFRILNPENVE